jgi:hypothetical protein
MYTFNDITVTGYRVADLSEVAGYIVPNQAGTVLGLFNNACHGFVAHFHHRR